MFGVKKGSDKCPFFTYSMKDALKDKLTMDVTKNYRTVAVMAKIALADGSELPSNQKIFTGGRRITHSIVRVTSLDIVSRNLTL
jgi:hypothetical protein